MVVDTNIVILILIALVFVLALQVLRLEIKMRKFVRGKNGKSLEDTIVRITGTLNTFGKQQNAVHKYLEDVEHRLQRSVQGIHTIRFNPFKGTGGGGNQSFATAIIDEKGNGVIISSLYSRDHVSVFAKPVIKHKSEHELTAEEKEALSKALQK